MDGMVSIAYLSTVTSAFGTSDIRRILESSRLNNVTLEITGVLLLKGETFVQILEGPEEFVDRLFTRISKDARHDAVVMLARREITEREFAGWTMGFEDLEGLDATRWRGYSDILNRPFDARSFLEDPTRLSRLEQLIGLFRVYA